MDDIGNRLSSTANGQVSTYTPDNANLNRYASRTLPGVADLLGSADPAAHVTVDNQPTTRQDMYWHAQMDVDNAGSDVYEECQIVGVLTDQEPSGEDAVATESRRRRERCISNEKQCQIDVVHGANARQTSSC